MSSLFGGSYNGTKKCVSCVYRGVLGNSTVYCNYLRLNKRMRPCEPGDTCTVYKKGKLQIDKEEQEIQAE